MTALKKLTPFVLLAFSIFEFTHLHAAAPDMERFDITALSVIEKTSQFSSQAENVNQISTIGVIRNDSAIRAENIVIEVRYFDEQKKLVDVLTQSLGKLIVEPGKESAFKVYSEADKPKSAYVESVVRIVSAQQIRKGNIRSLLGDIFVSWFPMFVLIAVYAIYMQKVAGKKSPSQRTADTLDKQLTLQTRQLEATERLAIALEKIASAK